MVTALLLAEGLAEGLAALGSEEEVDPSAEVEAEAGGGPPPTPPPPWTAVDDVVAEEVLRD